MAQHFLSEIHGSVPRGFGTHQRATERQPFAGKYAVRTVGKLLDHTRHETHLPSAYANVASGDVSVRPQMTMQFGGESLTETHHLAGAASLGIEVGASLARAHRQGGECILEGLLESQKLENGHVDRRVETNAALVRTNGRVVLDAITAINTHLTGIIYPRHTKLNGALRLNETLEQTVLSVTRVLLNERP